MSQIRRAGLSQDRTAEGEEPAADGPPFAPQPAHRSSQERDLGGAKPLHSTQVQVVKVGGSLYDLPDLAQRLHNYLKPLADTGPVLLVPGGGRTADVIRWLDPLHGLGEERAHWLALRSLTLNAHFLASILPSGCVVSTLSECLAAWQGQQQPILDPHAFALGDEGQPGCLPHLWAATSDSLAARVAVVFGASTLTLLKSVEAEEGGDWQELARRGVVDALFTQVLAQPNVAQPPTLRVRLVNFRT